MMHLQHGDSYPCCGARVGLWHYQDCFERRILPDDVVDERETDFGTMRLVQRGPTYKALKAATPAYDTPYTRP